MDLNFVILFPIFIFSVIFHEYVHGFIADKCGDDTAKMMGRLTLNPIKHIDIFGTIILPVLLLVSGVNFVIGWAKPVPINPRNFNNYKFDTVKVALAGVLAHFVLVVFTLIMLFLMKIFGLSEYSLVEICKYAVYVNVMLAVFNLLPIPPLDGSKIFYPFVGSHVRRFIDSMERFGFIILLVLVNIPMFRTLFFVLVQSISESLLKVVL